jgi:hypothetical protein
MPLEHAAVLGQLHDRVPAGDPEPVAVTEQVDDRRAQPVARGDGAASRIDLVEQVHA